MFLLLLYEKQKAIQRCINTNKLFDFKIKISMLYRAASNLRKKKIIKLF